MDDLRQDGDVKLVRNGRIGTINFSHPAHNSMPGHQLKNLVDAIDQAGQDPEIAVIILKSGGDRTFCAGASFDELASIDNLHSGKQFFLGFANVILACRRCPKILIGRVQGKAVGGGVGIAAAVDYCFATAYASIKLSELAVGIGPFVVGPVIERKIGNAAFRQLALQASVWMSAEWACEQGLYQEIFPNAEELDEAVFSFASTLTSYNPEAVTELKRVFWQGTEDWDQLLDERAATSGKLVLSSFTRNAIAAFKNKHA
ncbi:MAG: enoyl-CoA hydratase/isomerase family protein [Saprospiraceae bacterium]|nr:enoyl-CoA hydratase/isomerase family protein [Saprospiraceae bacterium]